MGSEKQSVLLEHTLHELLAHRSGNKKLKMTVLALITTHLIGMDSGLSFLREIDREEVIVRFSAEEEVTAQMSIEELIKTLHNDNWMPHHLLSEKVLSHTDVILIPNLSFSLVADILSFNEQRIFVRLILTALLTGKTVIALKAGTDPYHPLLRLKGMDKGSNGLKRMLYNQMLQLKDMGINLIDENEKLSIKKIKKTVINEETIRYFHQQNINRFVISKDMIMTPLARDKAKELNITLVFE
ncbi:hypothetical protein [Cytobacillus massiliigabonensis]|uniref:hypothetical protein n=1 Tax=Cytobacillus massiliigabonensis TaxID=1871011 RepID=UPI000C81EEE9|nr:hypothetical protein [Cytobacillus massiliigabonensis]